MKNDDILFLQASKQPKLLHHLAVGCMGAVMGQTRLSTTMNRRPRGNKQVGLNSKKSNHLEA